MWAIVFPIVALFVGRLLEEKHITAVGWLLFGGYWLVRLPYYAFEARSFVEVALIIAALPLSVYAAKLSYEQNSAIQKAAEITAGAGIVTLLAGVSPIERYLIEVVTSNTVTVIELLGQTAFIETGPNGYESQIVLAGIPYKTYVTLACTGIGSFSVFAGVFLAIDAPVRRRLIGVFAAGSIIYVLNIGRNTFISLAYGQQWFDYPWVADFVGYTHKSMASFYISHNVISQVLAVIALLGIIWVCVRITPELRELIIELLELLPESFQPHK